MLHDDKQGTEKAVGSVATALIAALASIGVGAGAIFTFFSARRVSSGSVETSDAATLWEESQAMRKELREEVLNLRQQLTEMGREVVSLRQQLEQATKAGEKLRSETHALRLEIHGLRQRLATFDPTVVVDSSFLAAPEQPEGV